MTPKNTRESYNGWTNYDTWNFKLWLDNEQNTQEMVIDVIKNAHNQFKNKAEIIQNIREFLEAYAENNAPKLPNGFYSDVLSASIRSVNYYQIADAYLYDYLENYQKTA